MSKKYIVILLLVFGCAAGLIIGHSLGRGDEDKWKEQARANEEALARQEGLLVSARATTAGLLDEAVSLADQIDELTVALGKKPTIKLVETTVTEPINVESRRLLGELNLEIEALNETIRQRNEAVYDDFPIMGEPCPTCPTFDLGDFQFEIGDTRAHLQSKAGNYFLVGEADLVLTQPAELAGLLGTAKYRTEVSVLLTLLNEEPSVRRWYVGAHVGLSLTSAKAYLRSYDQEVSVVSFEAARWRLYGGRTWFPRKAFAVRTGVFGDPDAVGLDLGFEF